VRSVSAAAATTAFLAFMIGFGLAVVDSGPDERATVTTPPVQATDPTSTTSSSSTTSSTIAIAPPPTVQAPVTTLSTTPPTTQATVTTVATTAPATPAFVTVDYPRDSSGRLQIRQGGTASLTITNSGGQIGSWFVQTVDLVFVTGPTSGTVPAGGQTRVTLRAAPEVPQNARNVTISAIVSGQGTVPIAVRITD
jgi:hypothetical protein